MAESYEQAMLRMGFDATQVNAGTLAMMDKQKKASVDYVGFWEGAMAKKDAATAASAAKQAEIEQASLDASWNRYKANVANKIATDKMYVEQYAARMAEKREIDAIANGSGGFGWAAGAAAGSAAGGIAPSIHGAKSGLGNTIAMRELQVMMREISRGNWTKVLGSFTIFANAFGGIMKSIIATMFSMTGIVIAGIGVAAYEMYKKIKAFDKDLDEIGKEMAEPFAKKTAESIKYAAEMAATKGAELKTFLAELSEKHETLAHWAEASAKAIEQNAAAMEKLTAARGNQEISAINLAAHMGMLTPEQAAAARTRSEVGTFSQSEAQKQQAMIDVGNVLMAAQQEAARRKDVLGGQLFGAENAAFGSPEAKERIARIQQRTLAEAQIEKEKATLAKIRGELEPGIGSALMHGSEYLTGGAYSPLHKLSVDEEKQKAADSLAATIKAQEAALLKEIDQSAANVAKQKELEGALENLKKAATENQTSLISINEKLKEFGEKYKDAATAMQALLADLTTKQNNNSSAQYKLAESADAVVPTIEMLAGSAFTKQLNEDYGDQKFDKSGRLIAGKYSLTAGDGPYANAAQGYERAKKQEMWDIIHGNGGYVSDGAGGMKLTGQAEQDRQNAIGYHDQLAAAGLETPAMQMQDLIDNGNTLVREIRALNTLIAGGVPLADATSVPSTD
jgi:hypothetical protein